MNRSAYCQDPHVRAFCDWVAPLVAGERPLRHCWKSPKWGAWACESVFDAYRGFKWHFSVMLPGASQRKRGESFEDNAATLDELSRLLKESASREDAGQFLSAAMSVMDWGGVRSNWPRLCRLGEAALPNLVAAARQLEPGQADTGQLDAVADMNAGFSKVYSLLLDGFPIYDSRVACAVSFLVRSYCQESGLENVPPQLAFSLPPSRRPARRDPSVGLLLFHGLRRDQKRKYAVSNLMTAWLLGLLVNLGPFGELPIERRLLALQSALFMMGYAKPDPEAIG